MRCSWLAESSGQSILSDRVAIQSGFRSGMILNIVVITSAIQEMVVYSLSPLGAWWQLDR